MVSAILLECYGFCQSRTRIGGISFGFSRKLNEQLLKKMQSSLIYFLTGLHAGVLLSPDGIFHCWVCWCSSSKQLNVIKNLIDVNRYRLRVRTWPEIRVSSLPTLSKSSTFSCIFPVTALIFSRAQIRVQLCYHSSKDALHKIIFHSVSYSLGSNQL